VRPQVQNPVPLEEKKKGERYNGKSKKREYRSWGV
jgi:hypothetical protein